MKLFLLTLILAGFFIYLNRSYAHFYNYQGAHFITNPLYPTTVEFKTSPTDSKRLVVLGDSLMAGTGSTAQDKSLAYLIAENLSQDEGLVLINLASPGVGIEDVLKRQVPQALGQKPDYIVLMTGINDVHNRMGTQFFENDYSQVLGDLQKTTAKITIINIPYLGSSKILYPPWNFVLDWRIKQFDKIIKATAVEKNLTVIDLYNRFKNQFKSSSDLYGADQFHPSDKGYALWASFINANFNK